MGLDASRGAILSFNSSCEEAADADADDDAAAVRVKVERRKAAAVA